MDTLTVTLDPGEVIKHLSAVDLYTRFSLAEVHTRATANLAAGFLVDLWQKPPSPLRPFRWTAEASSWRSLKRPASAWAFSSSCCRPRAQAEQARGADAADVSG